jgi:hypothetical protein
VTSLGDVLIEIVPIGLMVVDKILPGALSLRHDGIDNRVANESFFGIAEKLSSIGINKV